MKKITLILSFILSFSFFSNVNCKDDLLNRENINKFFASTAIGIGALNIISSIYCLWISYKNKPKDTTFFLYCFNSIIPIFFITNALLLLHKNKIPNSRLLAKLGIVGLSLGSLSFIAWIYCLLERNEKILLPYALSYAYLSLVSSRLL